MTRPSAPDLFAASPGISDEASAQQAGSRGGERPLADRLRPARLADVVGQGGLLGPDGSLMRMLERGTLASLVLWGPPGVGKTTI
ncbi:MAG: recombination factor protein RarA, partial [Janthinobacterium lividum]